MLCERVQFAKSSVPVLKAEEKEPEQVRHELKWRHPWEPRPPSGVMIPKLNHVSRQYLCVLRVNELLKPPYDVPELNVNSFRSRVQPVSLASVDERASQRRPEKGVE